ncbi:MAG TPA: glycosyl hydrolase [Bryobacteraceae bacterium]|nr:glycosyl hydrolase [Bryobacteraceae bacterium]
MQKALLVAVCVAACAVGLLMYSTRDATPDLESGWRNPPPEARPHAYWLWLNGYVDREAARAELQAMKDAGFGGVLLFDMGARGEKGSVPPAGPAFLSPDWLKQFKESVSEAKRLGLQVDFSVVSSWDLGGYWIEPRHASMGLYASEIAVEGGREIDVELPFPPIPPAAPTGADGKPAVWRNAAVLAVPSSRRGAGHEFVFLLDLTGAGDLKEAVLDQGDPGNSAVTSTMTPVREFSLSLSSKSVEDADFHEVARGILRRAAGPQRFALPAGTRARYARLRFLSGYDRSRSRWTLGEFALNDVRGINVAGSHSADRARDGASLVRSSAPYGHGAFWNLDNLHDGETAGPRGVYATAGAPPFQFNSAEEPINVTSLVGKDSRLRWKAPAGNWTILRYVVMNTGERLKVPSPNSDGWATDHFNPKATKVHMDYVIARLQETFGDLRSSGFRNLYLASYEVTGQTWSPGFLDDFKRLRGYDMTPYLPAIFGGRIGDHETTARFLHDYRKTLSDVLIGAYYVAAREAANKAGLGIKSEAGGPGPPIHNVPVDSLYANGSIDEIQGEFWPFRPDAHALWVVKETASAGHLYGKPRIHMEAFTSTHHWYEGPQDLKDSADRVFCEGGNHMVWHTWTHAPRDGGKPGWVYGAGSHVNTNVTWWPKIKPFIDYLSRSSFLLQHGRFVGDILFYYGDGGYKFVPPRKPQPGLGPGYDYDFINSDVILRRLAVRDGRFVLPDDTSYAVLVLPDSTEAHPEVLAKLEQLVEAGGVVIGPKPQRAHGLEGFPVSDRRVREIAGKLWGDLDGTSKTRRAHGKGRILWGLTPREVLASMDIAPDVIAPEGIDFIHRRDGAVDIYFVRNTVPAEASATVSFRVNDREPELWDPVSGTIHPAPSWRRAAGGRIEVPFDFAAHGSMFVVFRRTSRQPAPLPKSLTLPAPVALTGPWTVDFAGGPQGLVFPQLISWTAHSDPAVRAFSGAARYRTKFTMPSGWRTSGLGARLDPGRLWTVADATLNGKHLGIAWTAPFTLDASSALQDGANELVIEVVNTWHNKLVADAKLPPNQRTTRTNITVSAGKPWAELDPRESGLFGPVRIVASHDRPQ